MSESSRPMVFCKGVDNSSAHARQYQEVLQLPSRPLMTRKLKLLRSMTERRWIHPVSGSVCFREKKVKLKDERELP